MRPLTGAEHSRWVAGNVDISGGGTMSDSTTAGGVGAGGGNNTETQTGGGVGSGTCKSAGFGRGRDGADVNGKIGCRSGGGSRMSSVASLQKNLAMSL